DPFALRNLLARRHCVSAILGDAIDVAVRCLDDCVEGTHRTRKLLHPGPRKETKPHSQYGRDRPADRGVSVSHFDHLRPCCLHFTTANSARLLQRFTAWYALVSMIFQQKRARTRKIASEVS